jgi:hypothetical protein
MPIEGATLPDDPEALRALIVAQAAELAAARAGLVAKALAIRQPVAGDSVTNSLESSE